ncbi:MAG: toll/interleukin-1 receptor domain-containing protein [Bacteroidales bacterium]|nr:toll/interleukin-1 receptor domain-containing protein [Bacteroidales bacterium]
MKKRIFISYSSIDSEYVISNIVKKFIDAGISDIWFDQLIMRFGDDIAKKISKGIDGSGTFLIILSKESVESIWVRKELAHVFNNAKHNSIRIIPVLIKNCEIPIALEGLKYVNLVENDNNELVELIKQLKNDLKLPALSQTNVIEENQLIFENGTYEEKKKALYFLLAEGSSKSLNIILGNLENLDFETQMMTINSLEGFSVDYKYAKPHLQRLANHENLVISSKVIALLLKDGDKSFLTKLFSNINFDDKEEYCSVAIHALSFYNNYNLNELNRIKNVLVEGLLNPHRQIRLVTLGTCAKLLNQFENHMNLKSSITHYISKLLPAWDKEVAQTASYIYKMYRNIS